MSQPAPQSSMYDRNTNLTSTGSGRMFSYNLLNLPAKSLKNAGTGDEEKVEWRYLADGTKAGGWKWTPSATPSAREGFLYAGPFRLRLDDTDGHGIESVAAPGGRIVYTDTGWQPDYYITDHLGSTRAVLDGTGNVLRSYDYFPYGECIPVSTGTDPEAQYLFSGKEKQDHLFALDWYDSGARFQTADGIFISVDPLAEKYYHISPYAYCAGNPVMLVDDNGKVILPWAA